MVTTNTRTNPRRTPGCHFQRRARPHMTCATTPPLWSTIAVLFEDGETRTVSARTGSYASMSGNLSTSKTVCCTSIRSNRHVSKDECNGVQHTAKCVVRFASTCNAMHTHEQSMRLVTREHDINPPRLDRLFNTQFIPIDLALL